MYPALDVWGAARRTGAHASEGTLQIVTFAMGLKVHTDKAGGLDKFAGAADAWEASQPLHDHGPCEPLSPPSVVV